MKKLVHFSFIFSFCFMTVLHAQSQNQPQNNNQAIITIGAMSGSTLYLAYLSIGTLADGYDKKIYQKEQIIQLLISISTLLNVNKTNLQQMMKQNFFQQEDIDLANQIIQGFDLLILQASALSNYAKSGDPKFAAEFLSAKKTSWAAVSKLLGADK